jgi:hypothetical protein
MPGTRSESPRRGRAFRALGAILGVFALLLVAAGAGAWWKRDALKTRAQGWLVDEWLRYVQPHLPFKVEQVRFDESWAALRQGRISKLELQLVIPGARGHVGWRAKLGGPIVVRPAKGSLARVARAMTPREPQRAARLGERLASWLVAKLLPDLRGDLAVKYLAKLTVEPDGIPSERSGQLELDLDAELAHSLLHLNELGAELLAREFSWKRFGIEATGLDLGLTYDDAQGQAALELSADKLDWSEGEDRAVNLAGLELGVEAPVQLHAPEGGFPLVGDVNLEVHAKSAEVLWGDLYSDVPISRLPLRATIATARTEKGPPTWERAHVELGARRGLVLDASAGSPAGGEGPRLRWRQAPLEIPPLVAALGAAGLKLGPLGGELELLRGTVGSEGEIRFSREFRGIASARGRLALDGLDAQWKSKMLAVRGLTFDLPFDTRSATRGTLEAKQLGFRELRARLDPTPIELAPVDAGRAYSVSLGANAGIPLHAEKLSLKLGALRGLVRVDAPPEERYSFETSFALEKTDIDPVLHAFCIPHKRVPPTQVFVGFPKIQLGPGTAELTGVATAQLFDGTVQLGNISLYELGTDVPELDFDLKEHGIRLDQLADWFGFGQVDGQLSLDLDDVTFQGWLPTQYHLSFSALPLHSYHILFSKPAMRNLIQVISGGALAKLPGLMGSLVDFVAFKWLLVGYDVEYFGLDVTSKDGSIIIETHDTPEVLEKYKTHYILFGDRVKIPLANLTYPIVLEAPAFANFVQRSAKVVDGLKTTKHGDEENETDCEPLVLH